MSDQFTPNKGFDLQTTGENNNTWGVVLNGVLSSVDTAIAGTITISVTGVTPGAYSLTLNQYLPMNINFTGVLTGNVNYFLPNGVSGLWSIFNNTTGPFILSFAVINGNSYTLPQGANTIVVSNGVFVGPAQTSSSSANPTALVGTTAVNGTASTFMTSDSAPAINLAMTPTWTGTHQFNAESYFIGAVGIYAGLRSCGRRIYRCQTRPDSCPNGSHGGQLHECGL